MKYSMELEYSGISGAGGGSSGGKTHTPVEAPNTLRSVVKGRILDLIAFGPVKGLKDGMRSVYLDGTPVENADGSKNFEGITLETRYGDVDQTYIEGFTAIENSIEIGTEVLYDNPPVRSVSNNDADALLVTVQLAALNQVLENGDSVGYQISIALDIRTRGGAWATIVGDTISGKTTAPFPITYRVPLAGEGPFDVRVRRLNKESQTQKIQDKLTWTILNEVIDERLSYPNMALMGITVDSQLFGSTMPSRSYDMLLSIVDVPSNYDPETRTYTGLWNGTFKRAWTDNPAWCYYDLATHPIIGGGLKDVDKWILYRIGQYCDEMVEDGYGGMEPRFTCNTLFAEQEDAITALNTFASAFRGMAYWGTNTMMAVADMPSPVVKIASPSNVIDGEFEYVGTSLRERHSVAVVMWNDPNDEDKAIPEIYEDPVSIDMFGWRETRVTAVACNSRGQALRLAKWILYSERMETQTVQYKASLDHADVRPGDIIELADPDYQGARMSGRVVSYEVRKVTLDQVPTEAVQAVTGVWYLSVLMPDGSIPRVEVTSFVGNVANLRTALPDVPVPGAVWALSTTDLLLPQFRVVSVVESGNSEYSITATEYDPRKYDIVEKGLVLPERPTSILPSGPITPPMDLSFEAYKYFAGNSEHQGLVISWTPPKDARVDSYVLDVMAPDAGGGFATVYTGAGTSFDLKDITGGQWTIRVRSIAASAAGGIPSAWTSRIVQIAQLLLPVPPDTITVKPGTFTMTLIPFSAYPNAIYEFWRSLVPLTIDLIESNATQLPTGQSLVDVDLRSDTQYYYYVRGVNQYGKSTWVPAQGKTKDDFEDIMKAVEDEIKHGELYDFLTSEITTITSGMIDGLEADITRVENSVTDLGTRIDAEISDLQGQIENITDALVYVPTKTYVKGEFVRQGQRLYQAIKPVPANKPPPDVAYWYDLGSIQETTQAMAAQITQNSTDILTVDGKITATASTLQSLQANWRAETGEGELADALKAWDSSAKFADQVKVQASDNSAMVQRVTSLDASVAGDKAAISGLQEAFTSAGLATATQINQLKTSVDGNAAAIISEATARSDADTAAAVRIDQLKTSVDSNAAAITTEASVRASADAAAATRIDQLKTSVDGNTAAITSEAATRSSADAAASTRIDQLKATVDGNTAAITSEATARASADNALSTRLDTTNSTVADNQATVQTLQTALTNTQSAVAAQSTTLVAVAGAARDGTDEGDLANVISDWNNKASIQITARANADTNGKLSTMWAVKMQLNSKGQYVTAGIALGVDQNAQGLLQSSFIVSADTFAVVNGMEGGDISVPFVIKSGRVVIESALIENGSITNAKIGNYIQSNNYVAGTSGWKLFFDGTFEINSAFGGQARQVINNSGGKVFDENGVKRYQWGDLSV